MFSAIAMGRDRSRYRSAFAFTLLELIVAMAIVVIATATVLPVVSKARGRSAEIFCQANLRTLSTALRQYTMDHTDHYPFGFTFNKFNPANGRPTGGDSSYITWFSSIDKYLTSGTNEIILLDANSGFIDGATTRNFNAAFKCPSVSSVFQQQIHYFQHCVVMPHMTMELNPSNRFGPVISTAKVNQLYTNTAILWDTPLHATAAPVTPSMFWLGTSYGDTSAGFALPSTKIDGFQLASPRNPELRFRGLGGDRFSNSTDAMLNPAGPIMWASDAALAASGSFTPSWNADTTSGTVIIPTVGGPRFRHTGNGCNVLFADGSMRTLYLHPNRKVAEGPVGTGSAIYIDSDFRRNMLMIKWPPGIVDSNSVPTGG